MQHNSACQPQFLLKIKGITLKTQTNYTLRFKGPYNANTDDILLRHHDDPLREKQWMVPDSNDEQFLDADVNRAA